MDKKDKEEKEDGQAKAEKSEEKPAEGESEDKPKKDLNLDVKEKFGEPDYAGIAENGEFNLYKVSIHFQQFDLTKS